MRRFLSIAAASAAVAVGAGGLSMTARAGMAPGAGRDFFPVPAAAFVRPLGQIATAACNPTNWDTCQGSGAPDSTSSAGSIPGGNPLSVPGLGVPLGGVGAGAFMVNQSGTFGPWNFGGSQQNSWEMRALPQAAFHLREQLGGAAPTVLTLATRGPHVTGPFGPVPQRSWADPLPAWNLLQPGQGSYAALYPFGWMSYTPESLKTDVSMRFFSPIVAGQDHRTSLPVAYFDMRLANHTGQADDVSVMFTMPNAPAHVAGDESDQGAPGSPASVRSGLTSRFTQSGGVDGVTLSADTPPKATTPNTPDADHSDWTIAARPGPGQQVSYTTSWNANGDGADVYAPFRASGRLPDTPIDSSSSAGAISVTAHLAPGQVTTIPFVLAWDFPQVTYDNNEEIWMRRYTDFYGAAETATKPPFNHYVPGSYPFHQGFAIARDALVEHDRALADVLQWWQPIADDAAYPARLRTAALNQLSQIVFNNSFWEGGLVAAPSGLERYGADRPGTHLFAASDAGAGGQANLVSSLNVDSYGWLAYDKLFPNLERDQLLAYAQSALQQGQAGSLYGPTGTPYLTTGATTATQPAASPGTTMFLDEPGKIVYRWYGYAKVTGDTGFLQAVYPAMKRELAYLRGAVPAGSSLPLDSGALANTYDVIPQAGFGIYDSELYLLALDATIAAGRQQGDDPAYLAGLQAAFNQGRSQFETDFWDPVQGQYRWSTGGPYAVAVGLDTFYAQDVAQRLGLPDVVDPARQHYQLAHTFAAFYDYNHLNAAGQPLTGPCTGLPGDPDCQPSLGAPNFLFPTGVESPYRYFPLEHSEVWTGTDYIAAGAYYSAGDRYQDPVLRQDGTQMAEAVAEQIWAPSAQANGFAFDAPESWVDNDTTKFRYPAYTRPLAIWDLIDAIQPLPSLAQAGGAPL